LPAEIGHDKTHTHIVPNIKRNYNPFFKKIFAVILWRKSTVLKIDKKISKATKNNFG